MILGLGFTNPSLAVPTGSISVDSKLKKTTRPALAVALDENLRVREALYIEDRDWVVTVGSSVGGDDFTVDWLSCYSADEGSLLSSIELPGSCSAKPIYIGGQPSIAIALNNWIARYELPTLRPMFAQEYECHFWACPVEVAGSVVFLADDGTAVSIDLQSNESAEIPTFGNFDPHNPVQRSPKGLWTIQGSLDTENLYLSSYLTLLDLDNPADYISIAPISQATTGRPLLDLALEEQYGLSWRPDGFRGLSTFRILELDNYLVVSVSTGSTYVFHKDSLSLLQKINLGFFAESHVGDRLYSGAIHPDAVTAVVAEYDLSTQAVSVHQIPANLKYLSIADGIVLFVDKNNILRSAKRLDDLGDNA